MPRPGIGPRAGFPAASGGKTKRCSPAPWDCAAADNTPRPPLRFPAAGKCAQNSAPPPGIRRGTGNCPAPREVLPPLMKADVQASTLRGDSTGLREDVHAVRKRLTESHAARKTRRTPRLPSKTRQGRPRRRAGKTAIQIRKAPPPRPPFPRGEKRATRPQRRRSARKTIVFLRGCGRWPKQKVAPQRAGMTK